MERQRAYEAIAEVYRDKGWPCWTPEAVAEGERRMAIDDADRPDSTVVAADFALRVLDRLGVVEPYDGPGDCPHHGHLPRRVTRRICLGTSGRWEIAATCARGTEFRRIRTFATSRVAAFARVLRVAQRVVERRRVRPACLASSPSSWVESRPSTGAGFLPSRQPVAKR